jgi:hypothetical protein
MQLFLTTLVSKIEAGTSDLKSRLVLNLSAANEKVRLTDIVTDLYKYG